MLGRSTYRFLGLLVLAAFLLWPSASRTFAAAVDDLYAKGFGAKEASVRAAHNPNDFAAFASELLASAEEVQEDPPYQEMLYNKAYEIGMLYPVSVGTANEAMEKLAKAQPNLARGAQAKSLTALQKLYQTAPPEQRRAAAAAYAARASEVANDLTADDKYEEALALCANAQLAAEVTPDTRADLGHQVQQIKEGQALFKRATELKNAFNMWQARAAFCSLVPWGSDALMAPQRTKAAVDAARYIGLDMDRPEQAAPYLEFTGDDTLKRLLPLAAKDVGELSDAEALDLADWYHSEAPKPGRTNNRALWNRAQTYYQQFLVMHGKADAQRLNATRALADVDANVAKLPAAARRQRVVDILGLIDLDRDIITGRDGWKKDRQGLAYDGTGGAVRAPYQPPEEYDFRVEFTIQRINREGHVILMLTRDNHPCAAFGGGGENQQCAIEGVNDSAAIKSNVDKVFETNKRYHMLAQVRSGSISLFLEGKLVAQVKGQTYTVNAPFAWFYVGDNVLGLAANDSMVFHVAEVLETKGRGQIVNRVPLGQPPAMAKAPPSDKPNRVVDLMKLIDAHADAVEGVWTKTGTELRSDNNHFARLRIPYRPPDEYNFRITFTRTADKGEIAQIVSRDDRRVAFAIGWSNSLCGFEMIDKKNLDGNGTAVRSPAMISNGRKYTAVVYVRRNLLAGSIDGKLITECKLTPNTIGLPVPWRIGTNLLGVGSQWSPTIFHTIELLEITGEGGPDTRGR